MTQIEHRVDVALAARSYSISIGYDIWPECIAGIRENTAEKDIFLVSDRVVFGLYGSKLREILQREDFNVIDYVIPSGEKFKSWQQAGALLKKMLESNLGRSCPVIALGGGVIGDLAGFAAALYRRGVPLYQVPTTLLSQVDSSIGGKVAVNHPLGKNMIGTFYQPRGVWSDLAALNTLAPDEWRSGLAEVIKYGIIWDKELFEFLERNSKLILQRSPDVTPGIVERCCRIKAEIVNRDERDEGLRNILNFGHTIGHALESASGYKKYRHGEAVAIGMLGAFLLAQSLKTVEEGLTDRIRKLLQKWNLPVSFPGNLLEKTVNNLIFDKKASQRQLVFILPNKLGQVEIRKGLSPQKVRTVLEELIV